MNPKIKISIGLVLLTLMACAGCKTPLPTADLPHAEAQTSKPQVPRSKIEVNEPTRITTANTTQNTSNSQVNKNISSGQTKLEIRAPIKFSFNLNSNNTSTNVAPATQTGPDKTSEQLAILSQILDRFAARIENSAKEFPKTRTAPDRPLEKNEQMPTPTPSWYYLTIPAIPLALGGLLILLFRDLAIKECKESESIRAFNLTATMTIAGFSLAALVAFIVVDRLTRQDLSIGITFFVLSFTALLLSFFAHSYKARLYQDLIANALFDTGSLCLEPV